MTCPSSSVIGYCKVASITPLGEWIHDYKGGETNSRMQLRQGLCHPGCIWAGRYCKIHLACSDEPPLEGYALNERCFGVLG